MSPEFRFGRVKAEVNLRRDSPQLQQSLRRQCLRQTGAVSPDQPATTAQDCDMYGCHHLDGLQVQSLRQLARLEGMIHDPLWAEDQGQAYAAKDGQGVDVDPEPKATVGAREKTQQTPGKGSLLPSARMSSACDRCFGHDPGSVLDHLDQALCRQLLKKRNGLLAAARRLDVKTILQSAEHFFE